MTPATPATPGGDPRGLRVHDRLTIPWSEIRLEAVRSGGPGGQNVNKVASKVVLRFSVAQSPSLGERRRTLLLKRLASRLTRDGALVLHASRFRERTRNQADACDRLARLLREGLQAQKVRRPTLPTRASVRRRREAKERRAALKRRRRGAQEES